MFMVLGIVDIVGAYRRWGWLIDPDEQRWWSKYYSQAMLKRWFGRRFLLVYTYVVGGLFIGVGLFGFAINWPSLLDCFG
jgi:hypothetical protein